MADRPAATVQPVALNSARDARGARAGADTECAAAGDDWGRSTGRRPGGDVDRTAPHFGRRHHSPRAHGSTPTDSDATTHHPDIGARAHHAPTLTAAAAAAGDAAPTTSATHAAGAAATTAATTTTDDHRAPVDPEGTIISDITDRHDDRHGDHHAPAEPVAFASVRDRDGVERTPATQHELDALLAAGAVTAGPSWKIRKNRAELRRNRPRRAR